MIVFLHTRTACRSELCLYVGEQTPHTSPLKPINSSQAEYINYLQNQTDDVGKVTHSLSPSITRRQQGAEKKARFASDGHVNFLFSTTIHQDPVTVAFSVGFHSQVSSQEPNLKHSFHLICIITIAVASQHLPVQHFFPMYM